MSISVKIPSAVRDSIDINTALKKITTQVNVNEADIAKNTGSVKAGSYTATGDDATAGTLDIVSGLSSVDSFTIQILVGGANATADAAISEAAGTITVADGAVTYNVAENDVINWIAVGTV